MLAFWFLLLNGISDTMPLLLAVFLHEGGHALACRALGVRIRRLRLTPVGAAIVYDASRISYRREIAVALAGPLSNLCCFGMAALLPPSRFMLLFAFSSLALGVLNLLPIRSLDGGTALAAALHLFLTPLCSARISRVLSSLFALILWALSATVQIRLGGNLSLFILSVYLLITLVGE